MGIFNTAKDLLGKKNYFTKADEELEQELAQGYGTEAPGQCHAGNTQSPESNAKILKTSHIIYGVCGLLVFCGCLMLTSALSEPKQAAKNNTSDLSLGSKVNNPAAGLPDSYKDIAKYNDEVNRQQRLKNNPALKKAANSNASPIASQAKELSQLAAPALPTAPVPPTLPAKLALSEESRLRAREKALLSPIAFNIKGLTAAAAPAVTELGNNSADNNGTSFIETLEKASTNGAAVALQQSVGVKPQYTLGAGTVIPATLLTGVTSDVASSDVVAVVRQNVCDTLTGKHILIPQGARLIGTSGTAGLRGNKRLAIIFKRIILPDGKSLSLPGFQGMDGAGYPGLKDKYDQHSSTLLRTAFLTALFAAGAQAATGNSSGADTRSPGEEAVAGSVASMLNTAQSIVNRDANLNPTISIRPGLQFSVFINRDIRLGAYGNGHS